MPKENMINCLLQVEAQTQRDPEVKANQSTQSHQSNQSQQNM